MELPDESILSEVKRLRREGRILDAWKLVRDLAPPEQWPTVTDRLGGALLLEKLGAEARAQKIVFKAWHDPASRADARSDMFWEVLQMRGAFVTWKWLRKHAPSPDEPEDRHADHEAYMAVVLMRLRDFERARACLDRGQNIQKKERWFSLLRADMLQEQDLREEALALVEEVVKAEPDYITAHISKAELLVELGRDEDAVQAMRSALEVVQSGSIARRLANLLTELDRYDEVEPVLKLYEELMPLRDESCEDWLSATRCDIASHARDHDQTLHWARQVKESGFHKKLVTKLESAGSKEWRRVILPVPFVQQHHHTCAPAALTSIAQYWKRGVEHLEVADEICYDGTPDYRERDWAEKAGWAVREFRVTVESAQCLIDTGMPFVLNTVYPGGAHAQVVMGYDDHRAVLFIRDPGSRHTSEFLALESLEEQLPFGPRGFVMVPQEQAEKLASLPLLDSAAYDCLHRLHLALSRHDRKSAQAALEDLRAAHADSTLRWRAELSMARYDGQQSQHLAALEEMLKRHPKVEDWRTSHLHLINQVHGREAMLERLRQLCEEKDSHPLHWQMLALELHHDERHRPETHRLLRRIERRRVDASIFTCQADMLWRELRYEEATELYRLAACFDFRNEDTVLTYFKASRWVKKTDEALQMMRQRLELEGSRSSQPAVTLYRALDMLKRTEEALQVLEKSLKQRPDDAEHAVFVAGELALWNRRERAQEILDSVTSGARAAEWHRAKARLARMQGDRVTQMEHQRAILEDNPLDTDAHRAVASLLDFQEGGQSGLRFLKEACVRFRWNWHLHLAWLDWARGEGPKEWELPVIELLRIDPHDAWAHRERADALRAQERFEEAHRELDEAGRIDSSSVSQHNVRASIFEDEERLDEAREEYRRAICLDVDQDSALRGLVRVSESQEQRVEALRLIQAELKRQVTMGDGVLEFASLTKAVLEPDEVEACLREAAQERPDLWQTTLMLAEHLRQNDQEDEAVAISEATTQKFPLLPRIWMEHALNLEAAGRRPEAIQAGQKLRELNPGWSWGMRSLSEMMRKQGDYEDARAVLEELLRHEPQDGLNHGWLGEVLWDLDERETAITHLTRAVQLDPGYNWAWNSLERWGPIADKPEAVREAAQRVMDERPGEARTWMIAAERLYHPNDLTARLAALDKAISLAPDSWGPVDAKALLLGEAGRFDEALTLCRTHPSKNPNIRFREGWLLNEKGARKEAVKVLEEAVAQDPRYSWPWRMLIDWYQQDELYPEAERACRQLARIENDEPVPLGYLASVLASQKKLKEAREVFEEAVARFPHYEFAFQRLFWLHIEEKRWDTAAALLEQQADHYSDTHLQSRWFILHCRRERWDDAGKVLTTMLAEPEDDESAFNRVRTELENVPLWERGRQLKAFHAITHEALQKPVCNPRTGKLHVEFCRLRNLLPSYHLLADLNDDDGARSLAFIEMLHWIGERWKKSAESPLRWLKLNALGERRLLQRILTENRDWLRADPALYGAVCYTLHATGKPRETIEWLSDWRERGIHIQPYILNNLLLSLQETNQRAEAEEVMLHGTTLASHNGIKMRFHIWCAIDRLLVADVEKADSFMDAVNPAQLDGYGNTLLDFQKVLREHQADHSPTAASFSATAVRLEKFMNGHVGNPVMLDSARRACSLIGMRIGSVRPFLWHITYRLRRFLNTRL